MNPVLGETQPDELGVWLGTGYDQFRTESGLSGLAKESPGRLDILALATRTPGRGQFREFIRQAKREYKTICVWEIWNPFLLSALERYGFTTQSDFDCGEWVTGMRWDATKQ